MQQYRFNSDETELLVVANMTSSSLSAAGSLFIILFYIFFKELRNFGSRFVFYISLLDLGDSVIRLSLPRAFDSPSSLVLCKIQAYTINFSALSSVLWTTVIMFCLYKITNLTNFRIENLEKNFIVYAFGLPAFLSAIPFIWDAYGPNPGLCWISPANQSDQRILLALTLLVFYGPLWVSVAANTILGVAVSRTINVVVGGAQEQGVHRFHRLKYYPIALVLCWAPGTFTRVYTIFWVESSPELWLVFSCIFMGSLQGFLNSFIYGTNKKVVIRIKHVFNTCFKRFQRANNPDRKESLLEKGQFPGDAKARDNSINIAKEETSSDSVLDRSLASITLHEDQLEKKLWLSDKINFQKQSVSQDRRLFSFDSNRKQTNDTN